MLGKILAPLGKVLLFIRKRLFKRMDSIHQIRLLEPEEDFLLFLPLEECLLQAFLCPTMTRFWQLGSFDRDVPEMRRRALLSFFTHTASRNTCIFMAPIADCLAKILRLLPGPIPC